MLDPHDPLDRRLDSHLLRPTALPSTYRDLINKMPPPQNQGDDYSCVAFACTYMKEFQEAKDRHEHAPLSPEYVWLVSLRLEKKMDLPVDKSNIAIRTAMKVLQKQGICLLSEWKYQAGDRDDRRASQLAGSASNHRIASYASMKTCEEMRQAIFQLGPVVAGFPLSDIVTSKEVDRTGVVPDERKGEQFGHALCFCGYDGTLYDGAGGFIFENSWLSFFDKAKWWGYESEFDPGFGTVSYAYVDRIIQEGQFSAWRSTD